MYANTIRICNCAAPNQTCDVDLHNPGITTVRLFAGNELAGHVQVRRCGSIHPHIAKSLGGVPEICRLWVGPQYRNKGLARRLLMTAENQLTFVEAQRTGLAVNCTNKKAIALYESCGYRRLNVRPFVSQHGHDDAGNACVHRVIYMLKELNLLRPAA
jgi:ribosomal protein S18 acetylase RimI-like enzyme